VHFAQLVSFLCPHLALLMCYPGSECPLLIVSFYLLTCSSQSLSRKCVPFIHSLFLTLSLLICSLGCECPSPALYPYLFLLMHSSGCECLLHSCFLFMPLTCPAQCTPQYVSAPSFLTPYLCPHLSPPMCPTGCKFPLS
jgi:hypothetical protein